MKDAFAASNAAVDRLGERLRTQFDPTEADLLELNAFVGGHAAALAEARASVSLLVGARDELTGRFKSARSIIEKLKRQTTTRLSQIQDIGGVRVVIAGRRDAQDTFVAHLAREFGTHRIEDRRETPQHGYRAVHVIVKVRGRWIEIQVRTPRQHQWAELFEKIGDAWGRAVRYGGLPSDPRTLAIGGRTRADFIGNLKQLSEIIAKFEKLDVAGDTNDPRLAKVGAQIDDVLAWYAEQIL